MFDAWILLSRVVDSNRKVPDLKCKAQDLLLEVVDLKYEVPDLRSGGRDPPNLTPGDSTYRRTCACGWRGLTAVPTELE